MPNRLAFESSPYLLQHAHNPVDWYPWGEEALERAKREDKPILVSIGYAACHWCHVMERESFENEDTAAYMNAHFINIKIDREERPDLDHIYMDAVQSMTGSGGWPLNVFLTPGLEPFYGGTYYPPRPLPQRASWQQILEAVARAFADKRDEIEQQAAQLTRHLQQANAFGRQPQTDVEQLMAESSVADAVNNIMNTADREWGGFGRPPKFPQTFTIQFLLRSSWYMAKGQDDVAGDMTEDARRHALLSLDRMIGGGIYDQLGGGLARYATDREWLIPHFEKMLYDNALLLSVLSEAYQLTGYQRYRQAMNGIIGFVERELMHPLKGFYSALDADSEGEEGKFYVWSLQEVEECLGADAELFCQYYSITKEGNWEGKNILWVSEELESFARKNNLDADELALRLKKIRELLLARRANRVRPQLDDKVLLGWNALMNTALSKAYAATGEESWRRLAVENMDFLLPAFRAGEEFRMHHSWKDGRAKVPAFLDDYAWLQEALIQLAEVTGDHHYLRRAEDLMKRVLEDFSEEESGLFFYTASGQANIIVRKKEVYDGATPSGNAVMAQNLHRLGILLDRTEWRERSEKMLLSLGQALIRYPGSFGCWNRLLLEKLAGSTEIAIVGKDYPGKLTTLLKEFFPHRVIMATFEPDPTFPLLRGKEGGETAVIYVCRNFACESPVTSTAAAISLIDRAGGTNNFLLKQ